MHAWNAAATHIQGCCCILLRPPQRLVAALQVALQLVHPLCQGRVVVNQLLPVLLQQLAGGLGVVHLLHAQHSYNCWSKKGLPCPTIWCEPSEQQQAGAQAGLMDGHAPF